MNVSPRTEKVTLAQILECVISLSWCTHSSEIIPKEKLGTEPSQTGIAPWAQCGHQHW